MATLDWNRQVVHGHCTALLAVDLVAKQLTSCSSSNNLSQDRMRIDGKSSALWLQKAYDLRTVTQAVIEARNGFCRASLDR